MKPDIIQLNLSKHCIETELKRLYNQAFNSLIHAAEPDPGLERRFQNLVTVLETLDFQKLRGKHPELAGFKAGTTVKLVVNGENDIFMRIGGETISLWPAGPCERMSKD